MGKTKYTPEQEAKIKKVFEEFGQGKLRHGSKKGPVVTNRSEAYAIAMSEAGLSKSVEMSDDEFLREHIRLIDTLVGGSKADLKNEAKLQTKEVKEHLQKSFDVLGVEGFIESQRIKSPSEKAFLVLNNNFVEGETLSKSLDTSKLIKKKVTIHSSSGKVYEGYRYVSAETGMPATTGKESKETQEFKQTQQKQASKEPAPKEGEPSKSDTEYSNKIKEIAESKQTKSKTIRDLIGLGVYDPGFIMQMNPDININNIKAYAKEAGIDVKDFSDTLETNINVGLGNIAVTKDSPVYHLQQTLKQKDLTKILKDKKAERAKQLGITAKDKFDAYRFKLDQLIGDRMTRALIVYGTGGIGKSFNLEKKLEEYGKVGYDPELDLNPDEYDYVTVTGSTSPTDLYNLMYNNPKKLLVFDDCDSMWENEDMANMLKGALDTTGQNIIRYANPKKLEDGTYPPKSFKFSGQCIFISNLPREKFYQPLIDSRANALDMTMDMDQTLDLLDSIKYDFKYKDADGKELEITKPQRNDIIKVLHDLKNDLRVEQVNGRTLGNLAALKLGLEKRGHKDYEEFKKQAMIALDLV